MGVLWLFVDVSVDPQSKRGKGAYLVVREGSGYEEGLAEKVRVKSFEGTTSTRLELETLIWAWDEVGGGERVIIHTDSQNILSLLRRRERLESQGFRNKKNELLKNEAFYRRFYAIWDERKGTVVKVKGHPDKAAMGEIDRIFELVDRASRSALREERSKG